MFKLLVNNKDYISTSNNSLDKLTIFKNKKLLQGFYYGSSSCIDSSGNGWFIYINSNGEIIEKKKIKLSLYEEENLLEEIEFNFLPEKISSELKNYDLEGGKIIRKIYFKILHRFSNSEDKIPVELSAIEFI